MLALTGLGRMRLSLARWPARIVPGLCQELASIAGGTNWCASIADRHRPWAAIWLGANHALPIRGVLVAGAMPLPLQAIVGEVDGWIPSGGFIPAADP